MANGATPRFNLEASDLLGQPRSVGTWPHRRARAAVDDARISRTQTKQRSTRSCRAARRDHAQRGPIGAQSGVRIRGADERYFPVLINGINMSDPSQLQSQFSFAGLTSSAVRGWKCWARNRRYGSNAIAGVVNLTMGEIPPTRSGPKSRRNAAATHAMSRGAVLWLSGSNGRGGADLRARLDRRFFRADENAGNTEADGFRSTILSFRARHG